MVELSICIPTYQRASTLDRLLTKLLPQCGGLDVEVVISDNGSTDTTAELCRQAANRYPFVRYLRQPANVGFAANVAAVISAASGRYVWLLGDDDEIRADAVSYVHQFVSRNSVAVVLLNFQRFEEGPARLVAQPEFQWRDDRQGKLDALLQTSGIWASFMSIAVLDRKRAQRDLEQTPEILKSTYAAFWLLLSVGRAGNCAIASRPVVLRQRGEWDTHRFLGWRTYLLDFAEPINWARERGAISGKTQRRLLGDMCSGFGSYVVAQSRLREDAKIPVRPIRKANGSAPSFWFVVLPLLVMPRALLKLGVRAAVFLGRVTGHRRMEKIARSLVG